MQKLCILKRVINEKTFYMFKWVGTDENPQIITIAYLFVDDNTRFITLSHQEPIVDSAFKHINTIKHNILIQPKRFDVWLDGDFSQDEIEQICNPIRNCLIGFFEKENIIWTNENIMHYLNLWAQDKSYIVVLRD